MCITCGGRQMNMWCTRLAAMGVAAGPIVAVVLYGCNNVQSYSWGRLALLTMQKAKHWVRESNLRGCRTSSWEDDTGWPLSFLTIQRVCHSQWESGECLRRWVEVRCAGLGDWLLQRPHAMMKSTASLCLSNCKENDHFLRGLGARMLPQTGGLVSVMRLEIGPLPHPHPPTHKLLYMWLARYIDTITPNT